MALIRRFTSARGFINRGVKLALRQWLSGRLVRTISLGLMALSFANPLPAAAGNAPPKHPRMENRFLFVLETSSGMKSRGDEAVRAVVSLLESDLKGELREGDTIGLWTYNARLHAEFPMQVWAEDNKSTIIRLMRQYLRQARYEKQGHLDKVWPVLLEAEARSDRLTVIFIYDGEEPLRGTPFDQDLNALQKKRRREFRAENLPLVTILAARDGEFFDYTINSPSAIHVPHTADPLPPPVTNAPPVEAASPPPAPAAANPPVEPKPLRVIEIVRQAPPPEASAAPAASAPPENSSAATPVRTIEIVNNNPPPPAPAPAESPAPAALQTNAVTNPPVSSSPAMPLPAPAPAAAPAATVNAKVADGPPPAPEARAAAVPEPVPAPPPGPLPVTIASAGQQAALFVIAISLLTIAVALVVFLSRRSRGPQASLISRAIDRPR